MYLQNICNVIWDIEEIKKLDYKFVETYHKNPSYNHYYHDRFKHILGNDAYYLPNPMPSFVDEIVQLPLFNFKTVLTGFHRMQPGMVLPPHADPYMNLQKLYDISDIEEITRFIIFLEKPKSGHLTQIENEVYIDVNPGDCIYWKGSTLHAAYNMGTEDRYTLQITGF